jgi:hypothetical protein
MCVVHGYAAAQEWVGVYVYMCVYVCSAWICRSSRVGECVFMCVVCVVHGYAAAQEWVGVCICVYVCM